MSNDAPARPAANSIVIVDGDIISRHAMAAYLRHYGYAAVEAATTDEAVIALGEASLSIDVILCDVSALGSRSGFELASWVRVNQPS
jgi:CheY-like chemotaxis protein